MVTVRNAKHDDIEWMIVELELFAELYETKLSIFPGEQRLEVILREFIDSHVALVADNQAGFPMGFITGYYMGHPINKKIRWLAEIFWWVSPCFRGTDAAQKLLDEFTAWGRQRADWITFGLLSNCKVPDATLERMGYRCNEKQFLLEVN